MFFGEIIDKKMTLNELGKMASLFWKEIHEHFSHVYLDEYVIMPNHIHGILILDYATVGTRHGVSLQNVLIFHPFPHPLMLCHIFGFNILENLL